MSYVNYSVFVDDNYSLFFLFYASEVIEEEDKR